MQVLYLGSQSRSRQNLLTLAGINYKVIAHTSDECGISTTGSFNDYVLAIAQHKMEHLVLPAPSEQSIIVLTADTLMRTAKTKQILGKPVDLNDAKAMLTLVSQEEIELATGCCLERKEFNGSWKTIEKNHWVTPATFEFSIDKTELDIYFKKLPQALHACGAGIVEEFGLNFLKRVYGSFTTILGLPLFELRDALKKMNFHC